MRDREGEGLEREQEADGTERGKGTVTIWQVEQGRRREEGREFCAVHYRLDSWERAREIGFKRWHGHLRYCQAFYIFYKSI